MLFVCKIRSILFVSSFQLDFTSYVPPWFIVIKSETYVFSDKNNLIGNYYCQAIDQVWAATLVLKPTNIQYISIYIIWYIIELHLRIPLTVKQEYKLPSNILNKGTNTILQTITASYSWGRTCYLDYCYTTSVVIVINMLKWWCAVFLSILIHDGYSESVCLLSLIM